ncbi:phosphotransferase [uncultured Deinococcus sp.]|uniref:phosphotransferase family protein n=1 Tax=uncultured Deinococcus sp. TaxID=158789 RepID=UPI0025F283A7|nr:phosphotransferase [uncultured Deinococcus sp.]
MRARLHAGWSALRRGGPAVSAHVWPWALADAFPGSRRVLEVWTGEGAAFARYRSAHGPLFLKYLPLTWHDVRACTRLEREAAYLRDLAPLSPVAHAPHLHSATSGTHAHLLTRDLTDDTTGWGAFSTDPDRERGLLDVVRLLARHHAFWAGPAGHGHPALTGLWGWQPDGVLARAQRMAAAPARYGEAAGAVTAIAAALPDLLSAARTVTLVHGDIHAGQVLWPRDGRPPVLIDYGQTHPSVPGEDLAHLLAIRLDAAERERLGPALRDAYREELAHHGLRLTPADLEAQERAGLALNVLTTARQAQRTPGSGVGNALTQVLQVWAAAEAPSPRNAR